MRYYEKYELGDKLLTIFLIISSVIVALLIMLGVWKIYDLLQLWWLCR